MVAALWPATAYGSGLVRVFDRITFGQGEDRKGLRGRALALALVGAVPVLVLAGLLATFAGAAVLGDNPVETAIGLALAVVFGFSTTAAAVIMIYKVLPKNAPD